MRPRRAALCCGTARQRQPCRPATPPCAPARRRPHGPPPDRSRALGRYPCPRSHPPTAYPAPGAHQGESTRASTSASPSATCAGESPPRGARASNTVPARVPNVRRHRGSIRSPAASIASMLTAARVRFPIAPRPGPLAADMHREASPGPIAPFVPRALRRLAKQRFGHGSDDAGPVRHRFGFRLRNGGRASAATSAASSWIPSPRLHADENIAVSPRHRGHGVRALPRPATVPSSHSFGHSSNSTPNRSRMYTGSAHPRACRAARPKRQKKTLAK